MKKLIALLCLAGLLLSSGCMSLLEQDYVSVTDHKPASVPANTPEEPQLEAADYQSLYDAVMRLVRERDLGGKIRLVGYTGDAETDLSNVCMAVSNSTPLGAYAVYYITGNLNRIVSYYEADVAITYKKSAEQMASIIEAPDENSVRQAISAALYEGDSSLTLLSNTEAADEGRIIDWAEELYYDDPSLSAMCPETAVAVYPDNGDERIFDISFTYTYLKASLITMRDRLGEAADEISRAVVAEDEKSTLKALSDYLCTNVRPLEKDWNGGAVRNADDTAYGAIVRNGASSEGFAMAVKLLCDKLGIQCITVLGRRGGNDCGWNMVCLDGEWYHLDVWRSATEGAEAGFLKTDRELSGDYLWDMAKYPASSEIVLTAAPVRVIRITVPEPSIISPVPDEPEEQEAPPGPEEIENPGEEEEPDPAVEVIEE